LLESVRKGLLKRQSEVRKRDLLSQLDTLTSSLEDIRATMTSEHDTPPAEMAQPVAAQRRFLQSGELVIDLLHHVITLDSCPVEVTATEFELLVYMLNQAPRVVPPQELIREVQGYTSEQWEASAREAAAGLAAAGVRVQVEARETLNYRIREAEKLKVPYMAIVGEREAADGTVAVRRRGAGFRFCGIKCV